MDETPVAKLSIEARALAPDERARLALELLRSLDTVTSSADFDLERAWNDEAAARLARFDAGGVDAPLSEDVHARARSRLRGVT
jgi:putative addiction module component (TIGR02574 family)